MPLHVLGLGLDEDASTASKITFKLPTLQGWSAPDPISKIEIANLDAQGGSGTLTFLYASRRKTLRLKIGFTLQVAKLDTAWWPVADQNATGTQILQVTSQAATASLELSFGLLDLKKRGTVAPDVRFFVAPSRDIIATPTSTFDVLDPEALGVLRLQLSATALISLRLDASPRLRLSQAALSLLPVLRDLTTTSRTVKLAAHPSTDEQEFVFDIASSAASTELTFVAPNSARLPPDERFKLPLSVYADDSLVPGGWIAPLGVSGYRLTTTWRTKTRALTAVAASSDPDIGPMCVWFMRCLDNDMYPLKAFPQSALPLCASLRTLNGEVLLGRWGIAASSTLLQRQDTLTERRFNLPIPGMTFRVGAAMGYLDFGQMSSSAEAFVRSPPFKLLDRSVVAGDCLQLLEVPTLHLVQLDIDSPDPFHSVYSRNECERLHTYSVIPSDARQLSLLPVCGLEPTYVSSTAVLKAAIKLLDTALATHVVGDKSQQALKDVYWSAPCGVFHRRTPRGTAKNADIVISSYFDGVLTSGPELKLSPHEIWERCSWLEAVRASSAITASLSVDSGFFAVRNKNELEWLNSSADTPLDNQAAFLLSRNKDTWFSARRPKSTVLPLAVVKIKELKDGVGTLLEGVLSPGHPFEDIVRELNDPFRFPQNWTGVVLLEVQSVLSPNTAIPVAFGNAITFRYIAFVHHFPEQDLPHSLIVTKAYANPPDDIPPNVPIPGPQTAINGRYFVESRSVRIVNSVITEIDIHGTVYLYSFLGLPLRSESPSQPLAAKVAGHYDAGSGQLVLSGSIAVSGLEAPLGAMTDWAYWPFERIRITGLNVRFVIKDGQPSMRILLDGSLDVRERFGGLIGRKKDKPLNFTNIALITLDAAPLRKSLPRTTRRALAQVDKALTLVYDAAKWAIDSIDFSLGTCAAKIHFAGMNYSLESSIQADFPGLLPLAGNSYWTSSGYMALRFVIDLQVPGGALVGAQGTSFDLVYAWPLVNGDPRPSTSIAGLRMAGVREFALPLFPGVQLLATSFTMESVDIPGTNPVERVPWISLTSARFRTNWGSLLGDGRVSVGMFIRGDSKGGFATVYQDTHSRSAGANVRWLLFAQNMSLPPGYQWAFDLLEPTRVGDADKEDSLAQKLDEVLSGPSHLHALQPFPDDENFISKWLIAGGVTVGDRLVGAKFFHQEGAFTGITLDGPLIDALLGGKAISLIYKRGRTADADQYEAIIDLPTLSVASFEAHGGQFRLRLSPSGDFLLDGGYPFPDENGFRRWDQATSLAIVGFKAQGGFYVARYRGPELEVDVSQGTTVTRMSFGVAAAWGRHFTTGEGGWFKAELFIGFFGIFEGTLAAVGNELQIERLAGSGGVLLTATASITLWIVSARITIQAYAQLMVEYRAPTALLELTRPTRRLTRAIENQPFLLSRAELRVSAEFVLQVTFVVEIDLYFTSYSQSISATYRLTVGQSFPL